MDRIPGVFDSPATGDAPIDADFGVGDGDCPAPTQTGPAQPGPVQLTYKGTTLECRPGESVLDAFLRKGIDIPFSCRNAVCQGCLARVVDGPLPAGSQKGLKAELVEKQYFLPCVCRPEQSLEFAPPAEEDLYFTALVAEKTMLAPDIMLIRLEPMLETAYAAGQFINVRHPDGAARCYSLASVPGEDYFLDLHVKRVPGGLVSNWLIDTLEVDGEVQIQGPGGTCTYAANESAAPMLMVATGTGLAPLVSVVRAALSNGHGGPIHLYHGSSQESGIYMVEEMRALAAAHANFHYTPCISQGDAPEGFASGRALDLALAAHPDLSGWRVHLAGKPEMVEAGETRALAAGAEADAILADAFTPTAPAKPAADAEGRSFDPDPEMWEALGEGSLMNVILTDFYTRVFDDEILSPYFQGVTRQRLIEKVYSFLKAVFTGEKCYFGNRPRNAHHWMIITDEVFDYRERLMATCMREAGLAEHLIARWQAIEESFRGDIVKPQAWPKVIDGVEIPVEGFDRATLDEGSLCDSCERVVEPGEDVLYHLRLGHIYCGTCSSQEAAL